MPAKHARGSLVGRLTGFRGFARIAVSGRQATDADRQKVAQAPASKGSTPKSEITAGAIFYALLTSSAGLCYDSGSGGIRLEKRPAVVISH